MHEGYNAVSLYTIYYTSIIGNCTNVQYNHVYRYCIGCILYNVDTDYRCHICMRWFYKSKRMHTPHHYINSRDN